MKKLLLISCIVTFHLSLCSAQDTIACRNGKKIIGKVISVGKQKVIYTVPPDSTQKTIQLWRLNSITYPGGTKLNFTGIEKAPAPSKSEFYLSANGGYSVPVATYKDAIVGPHADMSVTFYVNEHFGLIAKVGADFNSTIFSYTSSSYWGGYYIFQQYMGGISYRVGGKPGFPWIDFVGLCGLCNATSPAYEQGGGADGITVNTPGNGSGFGGYAGISFTSSSDHFCSLTFGLGCLAASFKYANYTSAYTKEDTYTNVVNNTVSKENTKMGLALLQMYLGINLRFKKGQER